MAGEQPAQDGRLAPWPERYFPARGEPRHALYDRGATHQQVMQGVVEPIQLLAELGEGREGRRLGIDNGSGAGHVLCTADALE